jgi:hypothetical protein
VPGGTAVFSFTVVPSGATTFSADIALSVSGLPTGATYILTPASITTGESATDVTLTISLPQLSAGASTADSDMYRVANAGGASNSLAGRLAPFRLAILLLPFVQRMRRTGKRMGRTLSVLLVVAAGVAATDGINGCGSNNGFFAQQQETYSLTITGTAGSLSHTVAVSLTVE